MNMKRLGSCVLFLFIFMTIGGSQVQLQGKITEQETGEAVLFGSVKLYQDSVIVTSAETDLDGNYVMTNLFPGNYELEVNYVGLRRYRVQIFLEDSMTTKDVQLAYNIICCGGCITYYNYPLLIELDNLSSGRTFDLGSSEPEGRPFVLFKKRKMVILGSVFDDRTSKSMEGVTIKLYENGIVIDTCMTDQNGSYNFYPVCKGKYDLDISLPGYQLSRQHLDIKKGRNEYLYTRLIKKRRIN